NGATTEVPSSSMATPSTVNPFEPYLFCISISQGISILQGSHQVAQKFTSTTFPAGMSLSSKFLMTMPVSALCLQPVLVQTASAVIKAIRTVLFIEFLFNKYISTVAYLPVSECSNHKTNVFKPLSLPVSQVSRFTKIRAPTNSSNAPLNSS